MIKYKKIFLFSLCLSLLASNEYFASVKYRLCRVKRLFGGQILFTTDFHTIAKIDTTFHECLPDRFLQSRYTVYDNELKNYICSVKTDNYCAYIFFRILESILSECSGVYRRKRINKHFGLFYGSEVGFFFNVPRLHFKNKYFTVGLFDEVRFNVISALLYITKAMFVENIYTYGRSRGSILHIVYAIYCIPAIINGFHIIHVNFLKIITLNLINILKCITLIILKTVQPSIIGEGLNPFRKEKVRHEKMEINVDRISGNTYITLYSYNLFNWLLDFKEKHDGLPKAFYDVPGYDNPIKISDDNFWDYELRYQNGDPFPSYAIYEFVKKVKSIRRMNLITNILKYIWRMLSPSISFDLTTIFSHNNKDR